MTAHPAITFVETTEPRAYILLVDDDDVQRKLAHALLEHAGFEVESVSSAGKAIGSIARRRPDLILSDVVMDDIDGFTFCRIVRRDPLVASTPVILFSACFNEELDGALAREVGATALATRDPSLQAVIELIRRSLAGTPSSMVVSLPQTDLHTRRFAHHLTRQRHDLARYEARFKALFQRADDAVALLREDGTILDVNERWAKLLRHRRHQLIGTHVGDLVALWQSPTNVQKNEGDLDVHLLDRTEPIPFVGDDGAVAFVEFTSVRIPADGGEQILSVGRDVTKMVESGRRLAASERRYRSLVESIPEVVWSRDANFDLTFVSPNIEALTGFTPEHVFVAVQDPFVRFHPDDAERARREITDLIHFGTPLNTEVRWQHRDGRWLWVHSRAERTYDEKGAASYSGIVSDVTERKTLEAELAQSQKVEAIGQLTAGLAHDFKNILAVILPNADLLIDDLPEGDCREMAKDVRAAATRGLELTTNLLGFARRSVVASTPLALDEVVEGLRPMLSRVLSAAISLTTAHHGSSGWIRANVGEMEQVLMNLVVNARDAMPRGGTISIETADVDVEPGDACFAQVLCSGSYVRLSVRDTGTGMDAQTRRRVFEPFFTTKEKGLGTGLGMSTCNGIVRRHGGTITVDTEVGVGTTFNIYFPRIDAPRESSVQMCIKESG